ncbi:thiol-disulfide oxidoreductase DCC family protein [Gaopeijia maritima]|uniref:Thiol-disulfide oxidoreductase DCC family protein n=1 Tax=Gaopeijia maritima TaxID=3119007 RepID=A0ABU9EDF9_9BACT
MTGPVLLYDGLCGFCDGAVQWILAHDRRGEIRFAALQGDSGQAVVAEHSELRGVDSLILLDESGRVRVRSDAALAVATAMGGVWRLFAVFRVVPRPLRDALYDAFARNRYRWFGRREACRVPSAEERERFLG